MLVILKNLVRIVFAFEPKRTIILYYQTQEHFLSKSQRGKLGISLEILANLKNLVYSSIVLNLNVLLCYIVRKEHYLRIAQFGKLGISLEILGNLKNLDNLVHTLIALDSKHTLMLYCQHRSII